jgi:DNA-binding response OmpR family regulator
VAPKQNSILFVDDDDELREMTKELLTISGYMVDEASDGLVAMEKLQSQKYDLLLLDISMPGKSGLDLLQFARDHSEIPHHHADGNGPAIIF